MADVYTELDLKGLRRLFPERAVKAELEDDLFLARMNCTEETVVTDRPLRVDAYLVILCYGGRIEIEINRHVHVLDACSMLIYTPHNIMRMHKVDPEPGKPVRFAVAAIATDLLTIFMGVMMGAPVAEKGIDELSKAVAESAVTRMPRMALTKTAIFPIAAQVAKMIGSRLSKDGFAKGIGRFIPLAGGLFSGSLTLLTFRKGANRLRRQLRAQRHLFDDGAIDTIELAGIKSSFVKAHEAERDPQKVQIAIIQAMINIAKINDEVTPEKYQTIEQHIARAKIDSQDKLDLLSNIDSDKSYDVDFDLLSTDREAAQQTYDAMLSLTSQDDQLTMAEKIYLNMAAQKMGIPRE